MSNKPGRNPTIYNKTLTDVDTEYSQALPSDTVKFEVRCRTAAAVKLAFTSSESGTTYFTIPAGASYWEDEVQTNKTLYFQSATAGVVLEIKAWNF